MAETYTSGVWIVKEGEEDAFVAAWREFASWGHTWPGCGTLRLVRDHYEPNRYMSFGPWESFDAQQAWKDDPAFKERIMRVRQHVDDFTPSVFELVTAVD
jgi:heme-degrading monooxygenase HmoA